MSEALPDGWKVKTIGDIGSVVTGSTPSTKNPDYWDGGIPFISPADFDGRVYVEETTRTLSHTGLQKGRVLPKDAILVTCIGSIGGVAMTSKPSVTNQQINAVIAKKGENSRYHFYNILFNISKLDKAAGTTTIPIINKSVFSQLNLLFPPVTEQQKIATILSSVDDVIEKTRAQIEKLNDLKTGMMQELLTKGIGHTEFKESSVGRIPTTWHVGSFNSLCVLQRGFDLPVQHREDGKVPILGSNGIVGYHSESRAQGPCVVTGRSGSLGDVMYIEDDCWPLNTSLYIRDFLGNDKKYIYYFLIDFDVARFGTGTGVPTLNRNDVHTVFVSIPPVSEQKVISKILTSIDQNIIEVEKKLASTEQLKKALMQDLLTGKVRVTIDTEEVAVA